MGNLRHDTSLDDGEKEKQKTDRMIVVPLGAHLGVFSVLQRLRSVILTSLPLSAVSPLCRGRNGRLSSRGRCQSPVQRAKKHRSTMHILLVLRERASSVRFLCFCFSIEFILRLAFSLFVCHRCHIAFLGRDVISLFPLGAVCFVSFSPLPFRSVQRANVYPLGVLVFLGGFGIDLILRFSGVTLFLWGGVSLKSINQPINLTCYFLFEM